MSYTINDQLWKTCKICNKHIQDLAKIYGGGGIYYKQVFEKHVKIDHKLTLEEYFSQYTVRPTCKCGQCNQLCKIKRAKTINYFSWIEYRCGRYPGQQKWSEKAKQHRQGKGNPMFGKTPWNKGLNKDNHPSIKANSDKQLGKITSLETRKKQSVSAKKRTIHGHTGCKHSKKTREKFREITIQRIKNGEFAQTQTKPHLAMKEILLKLGVKFEEEKRQSCWLFDFYLPVQDIYIEVDGDYFHSNPKFYPSGPKTKTQKINWYRDLKKNKYCQKNNITLLRFWECDILNTPEEIICTLKELLELNR